MEEPMNYRDLLQQLACLTVRTTIQSKILGCNLVVFVVLSAFGFSVVARGATYYVSSEGKDDYDGSVNSPFKTIQYAADLVNPGDTVVVRDGVYSGSSTNLVTVKRSGTADAWITFRSENKWGAILDGSNVKHSCVGFARVSYVSIEGFEIRNAPWGGLWSNAGAKHILVRGNHIHHIGNRQTETHYGICGIFEGSKSSYHVYDGNVWHDIGRTGPSTERFNHDHAIYNCGDHTRIINNIFYNCNAGWGVHMAEYNTVDEVVVSNNVFAYGNKRGHIILWKPCRNIVIQDNIFYKPAVKNAINFLSNDLRNITICNNLAFGCGLKDDDDKDVCKVINNIVGRDPLFRNPDKCDFRILPGSPAIDTGIDRFAPEADIEGNPRPQGSGYDIGAYEHVPGLESTTLQVANSTLPAVSIDTIEALTGLDFFSTMDEAQQNELESTGTWKFWSDF